MLLRIEDARFAVHADASIRLLPLAIYKSDGDVGLAVVALELYRLDQHLNRAHSKHCASDAHELVNQM